MADPYEWLDRSLHIIQQAGWYRSVQPIDGISGATVLVNGRQLINFASNDYLGLAGDPRLADAAIDAIKKWGTGSTGSRLLSGHREIHYQLEQSIARLKRTEDSLVFSSGYLANVGTIMALVGNRDLILADAYNHSSLKKGALLSGATVVEFKHGDPGDLLSKLNQFRLRYRRCLILTDTVFSMDGDLCPLPEILDLSEQFEAMVLVDEAHGTGVIGEGGAGCVEYFGCTGRPLIQMGTLSKAIGSLGGYVTGSFPLIDFLRNRCPSWIYTTGLSPADTAAALAAVRIIEIEPERRYQLWQNVQAVKNNLYRWSQITSQRYKLLPSQSPILCIEMPNSQITQQIGSQLQALGLWVAAIRPPTTPTCRLRITLMSTHTSHHCEQLTNALTSLCY